jgi:predicted aspartyl protease
MWRLAYVLLLGACAIGSPGRCRLQVVADLPARLTQSGLEVTGQVNRTDTQLLVDTGAERTILTAQTIRSNLLARSKLTISQLTGVTGTISNADVFADMKLGSADFQQRFAVADIPGVGGLIGGDLLSDYDVELDVSERQVRLWKASACRADQLPWSGPRATLSAHVTLGNRLVVPVAINGQPVDALLDTGSSISLLSTGAARGLGARPTSADPVTSIHGVDGGSAIVRFHRFASMDVGRDHVANPLIAVGETQFVSPEMLLGLDYLKGRKIWISYQTQQVVMQ